MQSKTIQLRSFTKDDVNQYYNIAQDKLGYFPFGYCKSKRDAKYTIDTFINASDIECLAIINETNELVGVIILEYGIGKVQISYFIGIQYRQKGYCKQAIRIVEQMAKDRKIKIIEFFISKRNIPSISLAKKVGAKETKIKTYKDFIILQKNI